MISPLSLFRPASRLPHSVLSLLLLAGASFLPAQQPAAPNIDPGPTPDVAPTSPPQQVTAPFNESLPESGKLATGQKLTLRIISAFPAETTYQWYKNGLPVPGRTGTSTTIPQVATADAGTYQVAVTTGSTTILTAQRTFTVSPPSRFSNLSTRAASGGERGTLISGFVITGSGTKSMLQRAVAPVLARAPFNLTGTMPDPNMTLFTGETPLANWDNWNEFSDQTQLQETTAAVGAFPLDPAELRDAAAVRNYAAGSYTIQVKDQSNQAGIALLELYDASLSDTSAQLVNISTRSFVGIGDDVLVTGFVIAGDAPQRVLVRAVGPTLAAFDVPGTLSDPQFTLVKAGEVIGANDNWGEFNDLEVLVDQSAQAGAFELLSGSRDAAALFTLEPGAYTVVVSGVEGTTGQTLVELYRL